MQDPYCFLEESSFCQAPAATEWLRLLLLILLASCFRLIDKMVSGDSKRNSAVNSPDDDNGEVVTEVSSVPGNLIVFYAF
jgi:hypothetical protein